MHITHAMLTLSCPDAARLAHNLQVCTAAGSKSTKAEEKMRGNSFAAIIVNVLFASTHGLPAAQMQIKSKEPPGSSAPTAFKVTTTPAFLRIIILACIHGWALHAPHGALTLAATVGHHPPASEPRAHKPPPAES